jgi:tRNA (guanine37-N1)-methyltransferase
MKAEPFVFDIVTIFPDMFRDPFNHSIIRRAMNKGIVNIRVADLRDYTDDRHRTVDDYPYGGGAGMVLKPEPLFRCIEELRDAQPRGRKILLTSPRGYRFEQRHFDCLSHDESGAIIICGHYEGIDQRVIDYFDIEEVSIGDYVLSGGEFAAMVIVDAVCRLLPGVLGNVDSLIDESFRDGMLEYPQYTRPACFADLNVPEILLSGDHQKIKDWRTEQSLQYTQKKRPDLLK